MKGYTNTAKNAAKKAIQGMLEHPRKADHHLNDAVHAVEKMMNVRQGWNVKPQTISRYKNAINRIGDGSNVQVKVQALTWLLDGMGYSLAGKGE